jgi:hypothetical protein
MELTRHIKEVVVHAFNILTFDVSDFRFFFSASLSAYQIGV